MCLPVNEYTFSIIIMVYYNWFIQPQATPPTVIRTDSRLAPSQWETSFVQSYGSSPGRKTRSLRCRTTAKYASAILFHSVRQSYDRVEAVLESKTVLRCVGKTGGLLKRTVLTARWPGKTVEDRKTAAYQNIFDSETGLERSQYWNGALHLHSQCRYLL